MSQEVSPTGLPVIPPKAVPVVAVVTGLAAACVAADIFPPHTVASKVCAALVALGSFFGIVSPGWRKK